MMNLIALFAGIGKGLEKWSAARAGGNPCLNAAQAVADAPAANQMAIVRQLGNEGETAAGIVKNTQRIESLSGKAAYRVPDELTATTVTEVKNVAKQSFNTQIQDSLHYAMMTNRDFELVVRNTTRLSGPLQRAVDAGWITLRRILP